MPRILIADDEPQVRRMMEETLEELEDRGVEIVVAGNGMEALEAIRQQKPELVFLDMFMPKMNGLEVCNAVKKQPDMENVRIVLLTSGGEGPEAEGAGADGVIAKPLDPEELYREAVERLGLED